LFQPIEQPVSQAPEDPDLREVHMRIDESGQNVTTAQIADFGFRTGFGDRVVVAAIDYFAVFDREGSIGVTNQCVRGEKRIAGSVKDGGAENLHPFPALGDLIANFTAFRIM
jgi:hypothetical protein